MMKQSKQLDNIFNECLESMLSQGESMEQCLSRFPGYAAELKPLLEAALAVKQAAAIQPRPGFREAARHRFYQAMKEIESQPRNPVLGWLRRPQWATVVAIVLVFLLAGGGTVTAANASMPDEPLYPVKMAVEKTWLTLTPSALGKAELHTRLAERRMAEIARMARKNEPEQIEKTSRRFEAGLTEMATLSSPRGGKIGPRIMDRGLAPMQAPEPARVPVPPPASIKTFEGRAPLSETAPSFGGSANIGAGRPFKSDAVQQMKDGRRAVLKARVAEYAYNHPARLRELLRTAPESARPALLRAIAASERGYEEALRSLDED